MHATPRPHVRLDDLTGLTPLAAITMASDPRPIYAHLRQTWGPVVPVELDEGVPAWLVLDYSNVVRVLRDPTTFTRDVAAWRAFHDGRVTPGSGLHAFFSPRSNAYYTDGDRHTRLRAVVEDGFESIDERLLAREMRAMCNRMLTYAQDIFSNTERAVTAFLELNTMLDQLITHRREHPSPDLLSAIVHHPANLNTTELLDTAQMIMSAGHEMSVAWCTTTLQHLISNRDIHGRVTGGRLGVDEALNTVLVRASPTAHTPCRFTTTHTEIAGRTITKGDAILTAVGEATDAAHRDADLWGISDSQAYLAFGAGPHRCPADHISRIIIKIAVEQALIRLPDLRLTVPADELGYTPSLFARSAPRLPIAFQPSRPHVPSRTPAGIFHT
ncbi:cytochrome P450 [Myceligenerans salitolerans]|uniref:Cytochrome P450 n=1 Tax=Myceligenerans salitolerans TaxID=1230528 RepID=A0ABS3I7C0_9MICO|nr:cytochrome P450 [Myceligenerans salitolerans]MBO0608886.1 cytochrome P450 [Myceligenerans salitolerans]